MWKFMKDVSFINVGGDRSARLGYVGTNNPNISGSTHRSLFSAHAINPSRLPGVGGALLRYSPMDLSWRMQHFNTDSQLPW
jgi:hypothetical protein